VSKFLFFVGGVSVGFLGIGAYALKTLLRDDWY
jgi:hypothetical protein